MFLAALLLLAATQPRPFAEDRTLLDRRLETLRRLLPDGPTPAADMAILKEAATAVRLNLEMAARPPLEAGDVGHVVVDLKATGRFTDVDRFFRQLAQSARPIDVASLELKATPDELVRLTAAVRFAYRPHKAPLPAPPLGLRPLTGVPRPQAQAFLHDQALALAKSDTLAGLRRSCRNPRLFLSELGAIARDRPVAFTEATLADQFEVRGLTLGEAMSRELESRFERGFFRLREFLIARQGACRRFEARGTVPIVGPDSELPLPAEDPFRQDESPCRIDRDAARFPPIQAAPPGSRAARGPITLRLRDVDLADVFFVLHRLTQRSFLVDGELAGRVSLDIADASLEDVVQALRRSGLRVLDLGSLARVAAGGAGGATPPRASGVEPVDSEAPAPKLASFELKREGVREILAVMTEIDPTLAALGPRGFLGRASLWTANAPVADVRAALLQSVGLDERVEEGRRLVARRDSPDEELHPIAGTPPERRLALDPAEIDVLDFELAGVASQGSGYLAFAYLPTGRLQAYKPGDRLADAVVRSVSSTEVELETDEGKLRLQVPPLR